MDKSVCTSSASYSQRTCPLQMEYNHAFNFERTLFLWRKANTLTSARHELLLQTIATPADCTHSDSM